MIASRPTNSHTFYAILTHFAPYARTHRFFPNTTSFHYNEIGAISIQIFNKVGNLPQACNFVLKYT